MNLRRYQVGEEEEIWRLYHDTTRLINGRDYTAAQVERWAPDMIDPGWRARLKEKNPFVVEHDGQILGFAELDPDGHIDRFYTHHQWQRRGVGKLLFEAIQNEALRLKIDLLFTEVSVTAREFFLRRGFAGAEENPVICGVPARRFRMKKRLPLQ